MEVTAGKGGGGGHSQYILMGVCRGTYKMGIIVTGTTQKGGLRHGHESTKGS